MTYSEQVTLPPQDMVTERASSSVHWLVMVSKMTLLPFSSVRAMGVAETPPMVKVTICSSGKARPMPSQSTMGRLRRAAAAMGSMELTPPASIGMVAYTLRPK